VGVQFCVAAQTPPFVWGLVKIIVPAIIPEMSVAKEGCIGHDPLQKTVTVHTYLRAQFSPNPLTM
jgi:hypothetical protein